jgi:hypothetical protein
VHQQERYSKKDEDLILGMDIARNMGIILLKLYVNYDLVISHVRETCQTKHQRQMKYKHEVRDMFDNFFDVVNIIFVPRELSNHIVDNFARFVVGFTHPNLYHLYYSIKFMNWSTIPDNIKRWQVFEDNAQIEIFLNMVKKYTNMNINSNGEEEEGELDICQSPHHVSLDIIGG